MSNIIKSLRSHWSLYHTVVTAVGIEAYVLTLYLGFDSDMRRHSPPNVYLNICIFWGLILAYLVITHLYSYSKWQVLYAQLEAGRAAVEPDQQSDFLLFRGGLGIWYVFIKQDEIEVGMTAIMPFKKYGKLSEVKKLETGFGGKSSRNIFLNFHNYKWSRPHEEIAIVITQFNKPVALELMRILKSKAINSEASAQYIRWMETGEGM